MGTRRRHRSAECRARRRAEQTEKSPSSRRRCPTQRRRLHRAGRLAPGRARRGRCRVSGAPGRRLEAIHRVVHPGRDPEPDADRQRPSGTAPARSRQHRHPRAGARERRGRPLSRVHRDDRSRAAQAGGQSLARRAEPPARAARAEGGGAVRLQQHLCAGDDPGESRGPRHPPHLRPVQACCGRAHARPVARVPAARRRLAGTEQGLWRRRGDTYRPRPRPGLRRRRRRPRRRHRCLLDRRQARPPRPDGARGRPRLLSEVRRRRPDARRGRSGAARAARELD